VKKTAPQNILDHPRNARIEFLPEPHEYYYLADDGQKVQFKGATSLIGDYTNYFDKQKASAGTAWKRSQETGVQVSQGEILAEWKQTNQEAIDHGNYIHDALETFVKNGEIVDAALIDAFVKSYETMGLEPIAAEWTIYDQQIERASSIDGNFIALDGKYVIVDYKTNRKGVSYDSFGDQRMLFPLQGLYDSKYSSYSLQVSLYRYWVEKYYLDPKDVADLHYILWIGLDDAGQWIFDWMPALDLRTEVELIYNDQQALSN